MQLNSEPDSVCFAVFEWDFLTELKTVESKGRNENSKICSNKLEEFHTAEESSLSKRGVSETPADVRDHRSRVLQIIM